VFGTNHIARFVAMPAASRVAELWPRSGCPWWR